MNKEPLISVLLPAYNAGKFITEAINSITSQTYNNLEIIIINDGSTDDTKEKINNIKDHRIKLFENKVNLGLIETLNKGIELCNGKYIARMDADDFSYPQRIEKQIGYLENNNDVGLCASWYRTFGGSNLLNENKTEDQDIKIRLLYQCHICHPTVILRKSVLENNNLEYSNKFPHSEDYALWIEMIDKTKFYTYPEVLLKYRDHDNNISKIENELQTKLSIKIKKNYFSKLGSSLNEEEIVLYSKFAHADFSVTENEIESINRIISKLGKNYNSSIISSENLMKYLTDKWNNLIINSSCNKKNLYKIHSNSYAKVNINSIQKNLVIQLKLLAKGIIQK